MMKKFIQLGVLFFVLCLTGCSTPKFYKEIKTTYENPEDVNSKKDINNRVLKSLNDELKNTDHIIYFESLIPSIDISKNEYNIIVYDLDNNKYYSYTHITSKTLYNPFKMEGFINDDYFNFVYKNYRNGDCNKLKEIGEESGQSGVRVYHSIYEINLKQNIARRCSFLDIFFTYYTK